MVQDRQTDGRERTVRMREIERERDGQTDRQAGKEESKSSGIILALLGYGILSLPRHYLLRLCRKPAATLLMPINSQRVPSRLLDPLEPIRIAPLPRLELLRRSANHVKDRLRSQRDDALLDLAAFKRLEAAAEVAQVLGFGFGARGAVGVVLGFGAEDVALDALAEAVHAAFFLGLAGGEVGG